jgi:hypothetical protein
MINQEIFNQIGIESWQTKDGHWMVHKISKGFGGNMYRIIPESIQAIKAYSDDLDFIPTGSIEVIISKIQNFKLEQPAIEISKPFKVIIAGSRGFNNYEYLVKTMDHLLQNKKLVEIVSGTAKGADSLGEKYAEERSHSVKQFPANWDKYGKKAGYLRNEEMAKYADACVCFWDGRSPGTKHMIKLAKENNLKLIIKNYE